MGDLGLSSIGYWRFLGSSDCQTNSIQGDFGSDPLSPLQNLLPKSPQLLDFLLLGRPL